MGTDVGDFQDNRGYCWWRYHFNMISGVDVSTAGRELIKGGIMDAVTDVGLVRDMYVCVCVEGNTFSLLV